MRIGLGPLLTIIFMVLKLTSVINWSWWWVFAPLWIPAVIVILFIIIIAFINRSL